MKPAAVVIVGAGVMGASVAYHLVSRGWRDVLLVDRSSGPGQGSTGVATGGFRAQYGTAVNVRLSLLARAKLLGFRDETGVDPGYLPAGYLWLAETETELAALRQGLEVQHRAGLPEAKEISSDDIARISPAVAGDGVIGGTFCPTDGFIAPLEILKGYLAAALRAGARVEWDTAVTGVRRGPGDGIIALETSRGRIAAEAVVNAAGAWAGRLAEYAGVDLPVTPLRRQIAVTVPFDGLPPTTPMTIFAGNGFHFRVRDGRVLLLWPSPGNPENPFDVGVEWEWVDAVADLARRRVPLLRDVAIDFSRCRAGLYEMSPDKHAILGAAPGCPNLFLINGSSGHGVMHAPALGQLLAEIMSDGQASSLEVGPLAPGRFAEGRLNPVSGLL
jgi:sarcosine oxidase subunit beta